MPNLTWSRLNHLQLGRYAEYYAKMEIASYGFEIYSSEVDDHGVDFLARMPNSDVYYEVQVKSSLKSNYTFMTKEKMPLKQTFLVCYLRFTDGALPQMYLIPSTEWENPNNVLVNRDYEEKKSKPEWGISYSKKYLHLLEKYDVDNFMSSILSSN